MARRYLSELQRLFRLLAGLTNETFQTIPLLININNFHMEVVEEEGLKGGGEIIMGCDIHFHSEVKINGEWQHYSTSSVKRVYALFAKMANVRNSDLEIEPISIPKGLPIDCSLLTRFFYRNEGDDAHSESYLNAEEIGVLGDWMKVQDIYIFKEDESFGWLFGNYWSRFLRDREDYPSGIEDIRFVFWFDN